MSEIDSLEPVTDELCLSVNDDLGETDSTASAKDEDVPGPAVDTQPEAGPVEVAQTETQPAAPEPVEVPATKPILTFPQSQDMRTLPGWVPKSDAQIEQERLAEEEFRRELRLRNEMNRQWRANGKSRSQSVGFSAPERSSQNSFTEPDSGVSSSAEFAQPAASQKRQARFTPKIKSVVVVPPKKAKNGTRKPSPDRQPVNRVFFNKGSHAQRLQIQVPVPAGARGCSYRSIVVPAGASMNVTVGTAATPRPVPSLNERLAALFPEFNDKDGSTIGDVVIRANQNGNPNEVVRALEAAVRKQAMPKRNGLFVTSKAANVVVKCISHELMTTLQSVVGELDDDDFHRSTAWSVIRDYARMLFGADSEYQFVSNAVLLSSKESLKSYLARTRDGDDNAQE